MAAGNQGGAAARHLLSAGWRVRALTQRPDGLAAQALAAAGAEVVDGDMDFPKSLKADFLNHNGGYGVGIAAARPGRRVKIALTMPRPRAVTPCGA